jgi:hypothetical protein
MTTYWQNISHMYVIFDVLFLVVRVEYNASELCNYLYHITLLVVFWITFQQKKLSNISKHTT